MIITEKSPQHTRGNSCHPNIANGKRGMLKSMVYEQRQSNLYDR